MLTDLVVIQIAMLLAAAALALTVGTSSGDGRVAFVTPVLSAVVSVAVLVPTAALGLYNAAGFSPLERFQMRVYVALMMPWLSLALATLVHRVTVDVIAVLAIASALFVPIALLAEACVKQILIGRSAWGADVLLIGSGEAACRIADDLLAYPAIGLRPIGYCGDSINHKTSGQIPCLGSLADVGSLAGVADIAVVALSSELRTLDVARLPFDRIVVVPETGNIPAVGLRTLALAGAPGFAFANLARARAHHHAKRMLDLLVAVPALLLTLPLILGFALAIWLVSPGPVFYVQRRVGWKGRPVAIFKLRSMHRDAESRLENLLLRDPAARQEWQTYVKLSSDPRVLPIIGNFIRRTSIDELPQLWNVVRGDISLVGPRPFPAYHVEKFSADFQRLRCSVRPGLTGLWQVSVRTSSNLRQQEVIDTFYIRNWSLWMDFYIVLRTFPAVLSMRGAR